jgi:hypothetical protein
MQAKTMRFLSFAATVAGIVGWSWHDASAADHLLLLEVVASSNCSETSPSGNYYMGEAYAYDANNNMVCEVIGVPAQQLYLGDCDAPFQTTATQVVGAITTRTSSFNYVSTLAIFGAKQPWTGAINLNNFTFTSNSVVSVNIPSTPGCQILAGAVGIDTTSSP